ncbi:hypothetical protein N7532_006364 [Penicillium argentinense]|uniref:Uncharacterized protein n=1 Tax=Penicillium argentinense TaxID=1131581 RepID=A0A9W9FFQ5_9EURO|nr:uncharacterized protein N7532_006364 [Penicillium argentinense]KAJ5099363.1 hypothetical protein N7532_006364 [Penicillium argentinense]
MAGKRKRETAVVSRSKKSEEASPPPADNAQDIFRKYFEAQFEPIEVAPVKPVDESESEDDEDDEEGSDFSGEEWDGVSEEDEDENRVEVVEHRDASTAGDEMMDKLARKAFLDGKPTFDLTPKTSAKLNPKEEEEEAAADADNLKHDLALQRLLKESHLLESADDLAPTGKNRLKALDLRMQELGAKTSLYKQKMPDAHRRGINAKAASKDEKRRREAKENGIILERPSKVTKSNNNGRRERGVGGSSIGKFSGVL